MSDALAPTDEIVMVAGTPPIRAKKARYYEDARFSERVLPPTAPQTSGRTSRADGWSVLAPLEPDPVQLAVVQQLDSDKANSGLRREPELPNHIAIAREITDPRPSEEFAMLDEEPEDAARQRQALRRQMTGVARQVALDPNDGIDL